VKDSLWSRNLKRESSEPVEHVEPERHAAIHQSSSSH
jgi:hypothetical protein